jgi:hypothetical protein
MSRTFSSMSTKRRRIIIITLALFLLILIIGLAAGLSKRAQYVQPTPVSLCTFEMLTFATAPSRFLSQDQVTTRGP